MERFHFTGQGAWVRIGWWGSLGVKEATEPLARNETRGCQTGELKKGQWVVLHCCCAALFSILTCGIKRNVHELSLICAVVGVGCVTGQPA